MRVAVSGSEWAGCMQGVVAAGESGHRRRPAAAAAAAPWLPAVLQPCLAGVRHGCRYSRAAQLCILNRLQPRRNPLHLTPRRQLAKFRGLPIHCTGHKPLLLATVSGAVVLDGGTRAHASWRGRRACLAAAQ